MSLALVWVVAVGLVGEASTGRRRCPSCGASLGAPKLRRHMAFCAPDLLDPEGWAEADQQVVWEHLQIR